LALAAEQRRFCVVLSPIEGVVLPPIEGVASLPDNTSPELGVVVLFPIQGGRFRLVLFPIQGVGRFRVVLFTIQGVAALPDTTIPELGVVVLPIAENSSL